MACTQKVQKKRLNIYVFVVGCMNTNSDKKITSDVRLKL